MYTWQNFRTVENLRNQENIRSHVSYAIQSQYSASQRILALCADFQKRFDPHTDVLLFYKKMFNIYSAQGAGLDNWGSILQIGRAITDPLNSLVLTLDDEYYRLLLLYKAMANISVSTAAAQNELLSVLVNSGLGNFPRLAYVLKVDVMVIRWVFEDFLDPIQIAVFKAAGTLTRGAGVGWELYAVNTGAVFGFDGSELQPFNQTPFAPDNALTINRG
jgi:hypothetical protein